MKNPNGKILVDSEGPDPPNRGGRIHHLVLPASWGQRSVETIPHFRPHPVDPKFEGWGVEQNPDDRMWGVKIATWTGKLRFTAVPPCAPDAPNL